MNVNGAIICVVAAGGEFRSSSSSYFNETFLANDSIAFYSSAESFMQMTRWVLIHLSPIKTISAVARYNNFLFFSEFKISRCPPAELHPNIASSPAERTHDSSLTSALRRPEHNLFDSNSSLYIPLDGARDLSLLERSLVVWAHTKYRFGMERRRAIAQTELESVRLRRSLFDVKI